MAWDRTQYLKKRLEYEIVDGKYADRPIITRDSPIDGGVYLGAHQREAIVVDSTKSPQLLLCFEEALQRTVDPMDGLVDRSIILPTVKDFVREKLQYDKGAVTEIMGRYDVENDGKISLDLYLAEGVGVCRHQAVFGGFLLERFGKEGYIRGKVSVDRNTMYRGGHAWVRYTASDSIIMVVDPAQDFMGQLKESMKKAKWYYFRDEDEHLLVS